jgi:peroxiredoxin
LIKPIYVKDWKAFECVTYFRNPSFAVSISLQAQSANTKPNISPDEFSPKRETTNWALGSEAPNLLLNDVYSKQFDLYSLLDKPLVIEFTSANCAQCTKNKMALKSFYKRFNINLLSITTDEHINQVRKFIKENDLHWSTIYDDSKVYNQQTFSEANFTKAPKFLFITPDKKIHRIFYSDRDIGKLASILKKYFSN